MRRLPYEDQVALAMGRGKLTRKKIDSYRRAERAAEVDGPDSAETPDRHWSEYEANEDDSVTHLRNAVNSLRRVTSVSGFDEAVLINQLQGLIDQLFQRSLSGQGGNV
jgi:hypothetical protein